MKHSIIFLTAILALTFTSCQLELKDKDSLGVFSLDLEFDAQMQTKAMSSDELLSSANVKIYMGDFSGLIRSYKYANLPGTIYLPADSYRVDVEAGEIAKSSPAMASWDQKSYSGSTPFQVSEGVNTSVKVVARVCNAVTSITFDQSVASNFASGYTFTIGSGSEATSQLVYTADKSGRNGYFIIPGNDGSLSWTFKGSLKNGKSIEKSGEIKNVSGGKTYRMTLSYSVTDGLLGFSVNVDDSLEDIDDLIVFEPVSTGLSKSAGYEIWAGHATLHADVDESEYPDPSSIVISYSADGVSWTDISAQRVGDGSYVAVAEGLDPSTTYSYKLVIAGEVIGSPMTFTTDSAPQMPNSRFEYTSNDESSNWISFYDPSASDPAVRTKWWDNGSSASAGMLGSKYAICYSDTDVPSGTGSSKSAKLTSISAAGKLAAGNLFSGEFAGLDGLNGKVNFGRPWSSRPTAVSFWYKYKGGKVDKAGGPSDNPLTTSDYDRCQIKCTVGTWDYRVYGGSRNSPIQVNTSDKSTFWDYDTIDGTIAYGQLTVQGNGSEGSWTKVTVPLTYKSETEYPTYIVFSAAASIYGDYFVGSSSSILWLDEIELIYE